jgi:predicted enzyme related to lactoylglutathione lyase
MGSPVVHFEVLGKDPERLMGYYAELFGWEIETQPNAPVSYGLVQRYTDGDGRGIGGGIGGGPDGYDGHVTFYVGVPDVDEALANAERLGGTRLHGPDPVPGTDVVLGALADPEGHHIGVIQINNVREDPGS